MNIKLVKLVTGEEVIADIEANDEIYTLKKTVRLFPTENGLSFVPFPMLAKTQEVIINEDKIVYIVDVDEEIYNAYNAQFGTGIVLANANLKIV